MMFNTTVLVLSFFGLGSGKRHFEPCGLPAGCYCSTPVLHQIQCQDLTVFPVFNHTIKAGVLGIVIYRSNIVGLPRFNKEDWSGLNELAIIKTPSLPCNVVADIARPGLTILNECIPQDCPEPATCPPHPDAVTCQPHEETPHSDDDVTVMCPQYSESTLFLTTILLFLVVFAAWLGLVCYLMYRNRREVWPVTHDVVLETRV